MKYIMERMFFFCVIAIVSLLSSCNLLFVSVNKNVDSIEYKLRASIEVQNVEAAKEAIEEGVDINEFSEKKFWCRTDQNSLESNPLRIAIFTGCYDVAKLLLENGANPNYEDVDNASLLQVTACRKFEFIEDLIANGADIDMICKNGKTALEYAIANKRWSAVGLLLRYNPKIRRETIEELMKLYDNEDDKLWLGFNEIQELLKHSENKDCKLQDLFFDEYSKSDNPISIDIAAAFGNANDMMQLLKHKPKHDIDHLCECAALYGNIDMLKYLLDIYKGDNIMGLLEKIVSIAAEHDNVQLTEFILQRNPLLSKGNAAQQAAQSNSKNVLIELIRCGLNPNEVVNGDSLLKTACFYGNIQIVKILVDSGADLNGINNGEPLSVASKRGYKEIIKYLIANGADVNGNNIYSDGSGGKSVLMYAIEGGQLECVMKLVENGADIQYKYNGVSVINFAKEQPSQRIYDYLSSLL